MIHPVIRVVSFLLMAAFLSLGGAPQLLVTGLLLSGGYVLSRSVSLRPALVMLGRARWLLLSIAVIYVCFTPGVPVGGEVQSHAANWLPAYEGVVQGTRRVASLSLIVLAVSLLLQTTSREELLAAIYWLTGPLALAGMSRDRLAVRLALSLDNVVRVQELVRRSLDEEAARARGLAKWSGLAAHLYRSAVAQAETAPCGPIAIAERGDPPPHQWLFPLALAGIFLLAGLM